MNGGPAMTALQGHRAALAAARPNPGHLASPAAQTRHRQDIDGLRALAIAPVVLFHCGVPGFGGGYVGVDVFFVISGYLITGLIHQPIADGDFSLVEFYERRIRRIFPALILSVLATTAVAAGFYLPDDFKYLGQNLVALAFFGSNVLLWLKSGYFDHAAQYNPLLHLWSLAVEEQYYIVWPLLLAALRWAPRDAARWAIVALFAGSLGFGVAQLAFDPGGAFYLLPGRAWEPMLGSMLALGIVPHPRSRRLADVCSLAGVAAIVLPVVTYGRDTPFPGIAAFVPCLGAALIIASSIDRPSVAGRVLALSPFTFVGRISYSLYLWHWPLIVLTCYALMHEPGPWEVLAILPCALALSVLSWHFVESPFRHSGRFSRPAIFGLGAAAILAAIAFGLACQITRGFPQRLPAPVVAAARAQDDINPRRAQCDRQAPARVIGGAVCTLGAKGAGIRPSFALFGDSFGDAVMPGIDLAASRRGLAGYSVVHSGCLPLAGVRQPDPSCARSGRAADAFLLSHPGLRTIVVVARWSAAISATRAGAYAQTGLYLADAQSHEESTAETARVLERALSRMLDRFADRRIVIIAYSPEQAVDVPRSLALARLWHRPENPGVARAAYDQRQAPVHRMFDRLGRAHPNLAVFDAGAVLCTAQGCPIVRDGAILYADDNHLSRSGALALAPALEAALSAVVP